MENRPILDVKHFYEDKAFTKKVVDLLEERYYIFIGSKNGTFTNDEIEKQVYKKVSKKLGTMTTKQKHVSEAIFDSFSGMMLMSDSRIAFGMLRNLYAITPEDLENDDIDDDYVPEAIRVKKATVNIMLDEEEGFFNKIHSFKMEYFFYEQLHKAASDWIDKNIKYPNELERIHLEVIEHD